MSEIDTVWPDPQVEIEQRDIYLALALRHERFASGACTTCHHEANFDAANVPGNPKWALAPLEMAWQGWDAGLPLASA